MKQAELGVLDGVSLTYTNGAICESTGEPAQFTINMYCDKTMGWQDYDFSAGVLGDICSPHFDTVSRVACARFSTSELWSYLAEYKYYFGALLLLTGLGLVFVGRLMLKPAVCFAGFLTTVALSCFIYYSVYLEDESDLADFWFFLGGGALAGIIVGLVMCMCVRFGAAILAGWGGVCGAMILYSSCIYKAELEWLFWFTIVTCALIAAIAAFIFMDEVVIVATALLGAYCLVRGTACYAGHYYNEVTMAKMAEEGLLDEVDPWYWAYVAGFFVMVLVGMLVQCGHYRAEKKRVVVVTHPYMTATQDVLIVEETPGNLVI